VKWFVSEGEAGVDEAAALLGKHAAGRVVLVAPTLIVHELFGVLARRLPATEREAALEAFFDADVQLFAPSRELALAGARALATRQVSAFDSAYCALASSLGCQLATADRRLATALGDALDVRLIT
jgi:predicted nucleic acid-binding protein